MDLVSHTISWQVNALSRLVDATLRPLAEESAESGGGGDYLLVEPACSYVSYFGASLYYGKPILKETWGC